MPLFIYYAYSFVIFTGMHHIIVQCLVHVSQTFPLITSFPGPIANKLMSLLICLEVFKIALD